jgi:pyrroloquinoline quinone biosynthesis protein D
VARPLDSSRPRLAAGCRWGRQGDEPVVLFPEGMIRLEGTGHSVLDLCDGQRTVAEIVGMLAGRFNSSDPVKIREDVGTFLETLQQKRIVDY